MFLIFSHICVDQLLDSNTHDWEESGNLDEVKKNVEKRKWLSWSRLRRSSKDDTADDSLKEYVLYQPISMFHVYSDSRFLADPCCRAAEIMPEELLA